MSRRDSGFKIEPSYLLSYLFRRILVPVDGSDSSMRALEVALDFAQRYGSRISVVHVAPAASADTEALRGRVKRKALEKGVDVDFKVRVYNVQASSVANEIINEIVEGGYDLVILGARGSTVNEEILIGSVALSVAVNAATSIMIVR